MDGVRNEEVRRRAGIERKFASRVNQRVLRWFEKVARMDEYHMTRGVLMPEGNEGLYGVDRGLCWMGGVMVTLRSRGMPVEEYVKKIGRCMSR